MYGIVLVMQKEFITHDKGDEHAWTCICGNRPIDDGFYPCDDKGQEVEPTSGWNGLYVCDRCGRVVDQHTLEVMARRKPVTTGGGNNKVQESVPGLGEKLG
jgi:hypothetical protein